MPESAVTVYSSPGCMPCRATKRHLDRLGVPYTDVDVTVDPAAARQLRDMGYSATPVVTVQLPDGLDHWSGYKDERCNALAYLAAEGVVS